MGRQSYTCEFASPISPARMFKAGVLHLHEIAAKIMPDVVKSASLAHGDGSVGSIKEYHFSEALPYRHVKDRVDALDKDNFMCKYSIVEGGSMGTKYKGGTHTVKFEPAANGGCVCKVLGEIETLDGVDYPEEEKNQAKEGILGTYKAVEAYLIANPNAYA